MTAFSINGQPLFDDLFSTQTAGQKQQVLPAEDLQSVF